ncbi:MAG TPA: hypothetical protein PKW35_23385, partial [Nannocystaceae bacterium]|nr:hypothetical protein [Nannocystaceae bacterium]
AAPADADEGPRVPPSALPEVRLEYLKILGIKKKKIDTWLREGLLLPTDRPDVYLRTPEANRLIAELLAR